MIRRRRWSRRVVVPLLLWVWLLLGGDHESSGSLVTSDHVDVDVDVTTDAAGIAAAAAAGAGAAEMLSVGVVVDADADVVVTTDINRNDHKDNIERDEDEDGVEESARTGENVSAKNNNDQGGGPQQQPPPRRRPPQPPPPAQLWMACHEDYHLVFDETDDTYVFLDDDSSLTSFHQEIDFYYSEVRDDVCLVLDEYLHACASNRPHYHEVFVHYPIQYLLSQGQAVKRVAFLGGGDSMVLHEVLKYSESTLELVLGLELDQAVVRASFQHFGTSPHFDQHNIVRWYFGDASKTLQTLSTADYYGTFDLVIVDLLSELADTLKVNDEYTVMQAAMALMQPNGIVIRNEDDGYIPGSMVQTHTSSTFPQYVQDIIFHDVPVYCVQTFVLGSTNLDFATTADNTGNSSSSTGHHNNHDSAVAASVIQQLYYKDAQKDGDQFDAWYYKLKDDENNIITCATADSSRGTTTAAPGVVASSSSRAPENDNDDDDDQERASRSRPPSLGVMIVLEAENMTLIDCNNRTIVHDRIRTALVDTLGFTLIAAAEATGDNDDENDADATGDDDDDEYNNNCESAATSSTTTNAFSFFLMDSQQKTQQPNGETNGATDGDTKGSSPYGMFFVMEEGFVMVRCLPIDQYCAVDIQLWSEEGIQKIESVKAELIAALGSTEPSVFRIITGGMIEKPTTATTTKTTNNGDGNDGLQRLGPPKRTISKPGPETQHQCRDDSMNAANQPQQQHQLNKSPPPAVEYRASRYHGIPREDIDYKNATLHSYNNTASFHQWMSQTMAGSQVLYQYQVPPTFPLALTWVNSSGDGDNREEGLKARDFAIRFFTMAVKRRRENPVKVRSYHVGAGTVVMTTWSGGNTVFVWDGHSLVDLHNFALNTPTAVEAFDVIEDNLKYLFNYRLKWKQLLSERFPRGMNKVINYEKDYAPRDRKPPRWA